MSATIRLCALVARCWDENDPPRATLECSRNAAVDAAMSAKGEHDQAQARIREALDRIAQLEDENLGLRNLNALAARRCHDAEAKVCTPEERAVLDRIRHIPQENVEWLARQTGGITSFAYTFKAELARRAAKGG